MTFKRARWLAVVLVGAGITAFAQQPPAKNASAKNDAVSADHAARMQRGIEVFKKHVRPLFEQKCLRCHGGKNVESELDLSDRAGLLKGGLGGPAVVPGKSGDSLLLRLVRHAREPHMPKAADKLSAEALGHIAAWIDLGAPYDDPLVASRAKKKSWTEKVLPVEARRFWSFEPLKVAAPPAVKDSSWCRTPVDRYVLARMEPVGIAPNPRAHRQQLIRRAYFDLVGLPPPPEEVRAFEKDTAPDAFERLVDRLLQSPHYGERWARHWLDLARFAESHGFEHDYDRPSAYHYRDAVIEALNRDVPYDTFVRWQIAGDELEPGNNLAVKLTGFLAAGVHSTQITKNEVEKHRYDEMDDKLATLSTAFLGLTVGCARCHDHKYDAIPQRDYYRLLATFTTTVRSEMELNLDPAGYLKAKKEFDQAHAPLADALRRYEADQLPAQFAAWLSKRPALDAMPWDTLRPTAAKSKEGATLTVEADDAIVATGKNGKFDTYTITAPATLAKITQVRLEALTHPALVKSGPGRAGNGNFALSDFKLTVDKNATAVKLTGARASFEQRGLPVAAAIDGDAKSAWAVDPQIGKDHAAVFHVEPPLAVKPGTPLTFTLKFNNNDGHNLGRLRLSISGAPGQAGVLAPGLPGNLRAALRADKHTAEQSAALLKWYRTLDAGWQALAQKVNAHVAAAPKPPIAKVLAATEGLPAVRLHTQGEDFLPETYFLRRGDPENKEGVATQSFLQVLMPGPDAAGRWQKPPPSGWRTSYRRQALGNWLTDTEQGAGHLLARVIVNRLWQHHLGHGIVTTPSDFGTRGDRPSHPELLDYLADALVKNGWRLKPIHKLIMTSAVYQQSSRTDEGRAKIDRDNRLFWRMPSRRLEAEVIRDTLLAISGTLDLTMYGPGTLDEASKRRSIYFTIKRSKLVPMMVIFDAPEALGGMAERPTTTIAPQALHLLNNPQVRGYARAFALRLSQPSETMEATVRHAYEIALARKPSADELGDAVSFINQQQATYTNEAREQALADFCQVLMCLNEFVYVD